MIAYDGADAEPIKKWFANSDIRKSEKTMNEVLAFIEAHTVKSVSMVDGIIGCPHEEGIDYPNGDSCPQCDYWKGRDRFTQSLIQ